MTLTSNLDGISDREEEHRRSAFVWLGEHADLKDHLVAVERSMELVRYAIYHGPSANDDQRAVLQLGARVFNDMAAAWKLIASGYFQVAAMIQRDVIETASLVELFRLRPELIALWRTGDKKSKNAELAPWRVRKALDDAMGPGASKRTSVYAKFSQLGTHPTIEGLQLLGPNGKDAVVGPYMAIKQFRALLEEHAKVALHAGMAFNSIVSVETLDARKMSHKMLTAMMNWMERYQGSKFTAEQRSNTDRLLEP